MAYRSLCTRAYTVLSTVESAFWFPLRIGTRHRRRQTTCEPFAFALLQMVMRKNAQDRKQLCVRGDDVTYVWGCACNCARVHIVSVHGVCACVQALVCTFKFFCQMSNAIFHWFANHIATAIASLQEWGCHLEFVRWEERGMILWKEGGSCTYCACVSVCLCRNTWFIPRRCSNCFSAGVMMSGSSSSLDQPSGFAYSIEKREHINKHSAWTKKQTKQTTTSTHYW